MTYQRNDAPEPLASDDSHFGLYDLERMETALTGPFVDLPADLTTSQEVFAFMRGAAAAFSAAALAQPQQKEQQP